MTLHGGAAGDTKTIEKTLTTADANLAEVRQEGSQAAKEQVAERIEEVVADKGYHSNDVLTKSTLYQASEGQSRHDNILKRLVIHAAGFNLGLVMRKMYGVGKPKTLQGLRAALFRSSWPRSRSFGGLGGSLS